MQSFGENFAAAVCDEPFQTVLLQGRCQIYPQAFFLSSSIPKTLMGQIVRQKAYSTELHAVLCRIAEENCRPGRICHFAFDVIRWCGNLASVRKGRYRINVCYNLQPVHAMQIQCPQCGFHREIDESKIPPHAETATCPKCKTRFQFRSIRPAGGLSSRSKPGQEPRNAQDEAERPTPESAVSKAHATPKHAKKHDDQHDIWSAVEAMNDTWSKADEAKKERHGQSVAASAEARRQEGQTDHEKAKAKPATGDVPPDTVSDTDRAAAHPGAESKAAPHIVPEPEVTRSVSSTGHAARRRAQQQSENRETPPSVPRQRIGSIDEHGHVRPADSAKGNASESKADAGKSVRQVVRLSNDPVEYTVQPEQEAQQNSAFYANKGSVPWEYRGGFGHPVALVRTLALSVLQWKPFFAGIPAIGSVIPALLFFILLRGLQTAVSMTTVLLNVRQEDGSVVAMHITQMMPLPLIIVSSVLALGLLALFYALLTNVMLRLVAPEAMPSFKLSFKVAAYANTVMLLCLIPVIGVPLSELTYFVLFGMGLKQTYRLSTAKTLSIVLPLMLILVVVGVGGMSGMR